MRIVWKYTWVKIYVLLTILAVVKQFYSFAVLVDYFEYKKTALYLFQNDSGLRGNNGLSGLQNLPGLSSTSQDSLSMWFFWASAAAWRGTS